MATQNRQTRRYPRAALFPPRTNLTGPAFTLRQRRLRPTTFAACACSKSRAATRRRFLHRPILQTDVAARPLIETPGNQAMPAANHKAAETLLLPRKRTGLGFRADASF